MPKFIVEVKETRLLTFEIEADTAEAAADIAHWREDPATDTFDERVLHAVTEAAE